MLEVSSFRETRNDNYSANFSGEKSTVTLFEVSIFVFVVELVLETKGL